MRAASSAASGLASLVRRAASSSAGDMAGLTRGALVAVLGGAALPVSVGGVAHAATRIAATDTVAQRAGNRFFIVMSIARRSPRGPDYRRRSFGGGASARCRRPFPVALVHLVPAGI